MHLTEEISSTVQSYFDGSLTSPIEAKMSEFLTRDPSSRDAFRALGAVLEFEGQSEQARACYTGRIPFDVQKRFFNIDDFGYCKDDILAEYLPAHESQELHTHSRAVEKTPQISRYKHRPLISSPTYVARYSSARLWHDGYNTVVFDSNGRVDEGTVIGNVGPVTRAASIEEPVRIKGQVVLMGSQGSSNYYHWLTDILPKIAVLEKSGVTTSSDTTYVFFSLVSAFQIETLQHLGIRSDQIHTVLSHGRHISADDVVVPSMQNCMGISMGSWLPEYMKSLFNVLDKRPQKVKKILISRSAAGSHGRAIHNVAEFNSYFESRGYETVLPESYTVKEQAQLFSQATHIVGPHGAGMTNILFSQQGAHVYEFYGDHFAPCYWAISELSGLEYNNLDCTESELGSKSELWKAKSIDDRRSSSFFIDLNKIDDGWISGNSNQ